MKVVVCIKQVPDTHQIKLDPQTHTLKREGVEAILNPFDLYALEEGLRVRERLGGRLTVITMGPPQAEAALREAISYGADEAVLLSDRAFAGADTWATSLTLAAGIKKIGGADLIFCGKQAIDGDTAQVGPGLAEHLGIPHVAFVRKLVTIEDGKARVERLMDDGVDLLETGLPALFTVVKEINTPRPPSLKGKMRAKTQQIPVLGINDLALTPESVGLAGSFTQVVSVFAPQRRGNREMLEGAVDTQVRDLIKRLAQADLPPFSGMKV
jgi:electron transfer flavoprotein beta subunit